MRYVTFFAFVFCVIALISCSENRAVMPGVEASKQAPLPVFAPAPPPSYTKPLVVADGVAGSSGSAKVNPAHGLPGHKCEIAVGAPLPVETPQNLAPTTTNLPAINPSVQTGPMIEDNKNLAAGAGLNPAHGQPGHRCDVAVGARLPKGPLKNDITSTPVLISTSQDSGIQTEAGKLPADGLNPAHGQPGHRCDIEVGKPLNSPPKKN